MADSIPPLHFPKRFLWGAATSAHQVEGNTHNNWTVWELENAKSLAHAAPHKMSNLSIWKDVEKEAIQPENYVSTEAVDHYNRYELDFDIAKKLNLNAFRFSIEWSRIEPKEGAWDPAEIQHYREYIAALKKRGLEPMATLFHWTMPTWFAEKGGFEKASNVKYFVRYAEKILDELGQDLRLITTINEPDTMFFHGYFVLDHPPQKNSRLSGVMAYRNMLLAHKRVYKLAHRKSRRYKVGFTKSYAWIRPGDESRLTKFAIRTDFFLRDDLPLWYIGRKIDFIGANYYFSDRRVGTKIEQENERTNDLGWEMRPDDLAHVLRRLGKRKKPIIITESGVADRNDTYRKWWITRSLYAISEAIADGVDVQGYLHWSLLDNFEWAYGRWPRFGLVAIDYKNNLKRTVRSSGLWYGQVVKKMRNL